MFGRKGKKKGHQQARPGNCRITGHVVDIGVARGGAQSKGLGSALWKNYFYFTLLSEEDTLNDFVIKLETTMKAGRGLVEKAYFEGFELSVLSYEEEDPSSPKASVYFWKSDLKEYFGSVVQGIGMAPKDVDKKINSLRLALREKMLQGEGNESEEKGE